MKVSIIGYKNSSNLGYLIGKNFGPLFRPISKIKNNLIEAKIDKKNDLGLIANNVLGNYGRIFSEYVFIKNFRNGKLDKYISINGSEYLNEIIEKKKRVVYPDSLAFNFEGE